MFKKKLKYIWIFFVFVLIVFFVFFKNLNFPSGFSCTASVVQHNISSRLNMSINYTFKKNNEGYVFVMGKMHRNDEEAKTLARKIFFNWRNNGSEYHLISKGIIHFPDEQIDDKEISASFPSFFLNAGRNLSLRIELQKGNQYLFFNAPVPSYICKAG